jgi:hypothetical protein
VEDDPMLRIALAVTVTSARDVAITVTVEGEGGVDGAVYSPWSVIIPHVIPLHPAPLTLQMTTLSLVPFTVTTNCN